MIILHEILPENEKTRGERRERKEASATWRIARDDKIEFPRGRNSSYL